MSDPLSRISLASLRVFEAAARLGGFTRAASELGMTQAAVSWRIKALESQLHMPLFHRQGREVILTPEGERLAAASGEAMGLLRRTLSELDETDGVVLSVTAIASLANLWLAPRLGRFQLANADIALRMETGNVVADLTREPYDIGLRSGPGRWRGLDAAALMPGVMTPLCAPDVWRSLAQGAGETADPSVLREAPRIGAESEWAAWFEAAGVAAGPSPGRIGLTGDNQSLEVSAALAGQGFALGSPILYAREIDEGRLIRPFRTVVSLFGGLWVVSPQGRGGISKIARFRDWILAEAAADPTVQAAREDLVWSDGV
ncbi:LysR substrate-binding domain-containing protein [Brevundimonas sp.]|uniref:LysR substrate-binding domain-containing protein n=1 Tax=Brevundimonas sp. TaxID=1871086 RepID=UPI00391A06D3